VTASDMTGPGRETPPNALPARLRLAGLPLVARTIQRAAPCRQNSKIGAVCPSFSRASSK